MASGSTYCFFAFPPATAVGAPASFETFVPGSPFFLAGPTGPIVSAAAPAGAAALAEGLPSASVTAPGAKGFLIGSADGDELAVCAGCGFSESVVDALLQPESAANAAANINAANFFSRHVDFIGEPKPSTREKCGSNELSQLPFILAYLAERRPERAAFDSV